MEYQNLRHKAAGHDGTLTDGNGMLIFKPLNEQELAFYKNVSILQSNSVECDDVPLISWMPTFLGVLDEGKHIPQNLLDTKQNNNNNVTVITDGSEIHLETNQISKEKLNNDVSLINKKYLVLENLLSGFSKPNVMDIKLGKILFDENSTEEKKLRLQSVSESTTSGSLGFRICGMKIQKNKSCSQLDNTHFQLDIDQDTDEEYITVNKFLGRTRNDSNISDSIKMYFNNDNLNEKRKLKLYTMFHTRLQLFYNTLLNENVRLISSSLLFIYEGDPSVWDSKNNEDLILNDSFIDGEESEDDEDNNNTQKETIGKGTPLSSMSLIDFAHSKFVPGQGYDENVIEGIESLLNIFDNFVS